MNRYYLSKKEVSILQTLLHLVADSDWYEDDSNLSQEMEEEGIRTGEDAQREVKHALSSLNTPQRG